jgi:hypothetical protein
LRRDWAGMEEDYDMGTYIHIQCVCGHCGQIVARRRCLSTARVRLTFFLARLPTNTN